MEEQTITHDGAALLLTLDTSVIRTGDSVIRVVDATTLPNPVIEFDGHRFGIIGLGTNLPLIEMAYRARRGDKIAAELLTKFRFTIEDADARMYWPIESREEELKRRGT